jgi:DEAD/DEAH box helicase domain-containing protein
MLSMRRITLDIETEGEFLSNGNVLNLEVTVVGVYDSHADAYSSYLKDELSKLWPVLEQADLLVGFNSDHFDIPILNKYYTGDLTNIKSVDLLKEVKQVLGRRLKLDNLAEATLGKKKSGDGLEAIGWWKQGLIEKVRAYCLDDVKITEELYRHARTYGKLKYKDFDGIRELKIDTSQWENLPGLPGLTHTLPF